MNDICVTCGQVFSSNYKLKIHRKETGHNSKGKPRFVECNCDFCGRKFTFLNAKTNHQKCCEQNPNREKGKGHKVSEETKKKISEGMKKAHKEGRAGEWIGRKHRSYAEQSWFNIFTKDFGEDSFKNNFNVKKYFLDFAWIEKKIYFEVDGETHLTEEGKAHDSERTEFLKNEGWTLIGRCVWNEYQKLSKEDKEKYVQEIEHKIMMANPKG